MTTTPGGTLTLGGMVKLSDSATLSGGYNPGGTITFYLFAPGVTPNSNDSNNVYNDTVTVAGAGSYSTGSGNNPGGYSPTTTGTYQWVAVYSGDANNSGVAGAFGNEPEAVNSPCAVSAGEFGTIGFWQNPNGQATIDSFNGGSSSTQLGNWLASNFPNLFAHSNPYISSTLSSFGTTSLAGLTNAQVATVYKNLWNPSGVTKNTYVQAFAVALGIYADTSSFGGDSTAQGFGFSVTAAGASGATYNVGSNGSGFGVSNNTSLSVYQILQVVNNNFSPSSGNFYSGNQTTTSEANNVVNGINTTGDVTNGVTLSDPAGVVGYSPAQIRDAYGINSLSLDGTGQTIAIVDAYDNPSIFQAVDTFDSQFSLTDSGPTLYSQYGDASTFLTVLNQYGQPDSLPPTDPSGPGTANWELETELDVEWVHAIAPGAQILLVEANSQSLSDLMAAVGTAAVQPDVSVVSMSWGFTEGQAVFAADEANYDSVFNVPGVTFLASTGDYGAADLEYPAFSPNVVAVGGTTLSLNTDNSYNSETGWGYYSDSAGTVIASGGGLSLYEPEPSYQQGVQSTGSRTTPDVSLVADPATGAWIADPYNLDPSDPFEVVGGTSVAAPAWAGLIALVNQGRAAAGETTLNSSGPTETQQALYGLPQADYNVISSGNNGYSADPGYNLVTGLGTPVAGSLVPDMVAYSGPGTTYPGPTVGPLQDATLTGSGVDGVSDVSNVFSVFDAMVPTMDVGAARNAAPRAHTSGRTSPGHDLPVPLAPVETVQQAIIDATPTSTATPVSTSIAASVAPSPEVAAVAMMPLADVLAAHDAAFAGWTTSGSASPGRIAIRGNGATGPAGSARTVAAFGRARNAVIQAMPLASAMKGLGTTRSFLFADDENGSSPDSHPGRPIR
jgi:hypothetical protein